MFTGSATRSAKLAAAGAALALTVVSLAGCSAGGQSKADACKIIEDKLSGVTSTMQDSMSEMASDPSAATDAISELSTTFSETTGSITDSTIKPLAEDADEKLKTFADTLETVLADTANADTSTLMTSATDVQDSFTALGEACTS